MHNVTSLRKVVALLSATALVAAPLLLAPTGANASGQSAKSRAATPQITATMTKKAIRVTGTDGLRAGRVKLSVKGKSTVEFMTFDKGYEVGEFMADLTNFERKNDIKAFRRALANTTFVGGLAAGGTGTIQFSKPGTYYGFGFGPRGPMLSKPFEVKGPVRTGKAPKTDGTIIATTGPSWGGDTMLPMKGSFLFKNKKSTGVPHFVVLQQVVEGTTTDEVLEFLQSGDEGQPPWGLPATFETGTINPGHSMTADYDLPAGQYVVLCFFPDPKMGGMPHSLMGMLEMIHLM